MDTRADTRYLQLAHRAPRTAHRAPLYSLPTTHYALNLMDVHTIQAIGPAFVTAATLISGIILVSGYIMDWVRADRVGPGPVAAQDQNPS